MMKAMTSKNFNRDQFSEGGKSLADLVKELDGSRTSNEMTPEEIASHIDEEQQGKDTIRFNDVDAYVKGLKEEFSKLDDGTMKG